MSPATSLQTKLWNSWTYNVRKYLPKLIHVLNLMVDSHVEVMNVVGFDFIVDLVKSYVGEVELATLDWDHDIEKTINIVNQEIKDYPARYKDKLDHKLQQVLNNEKQLDDNEKKSVIAGLYLANYLRQIAFVTKYTVNNTITDKKEAAIKKLQTEKDFNSFNEMVSVVYQDYRETHEVYESLILTAFKLFQDLAEYIDDPQSVTEAVKV